MYKYFLVIFFMITLLFAEDKSSISTISSDIKQKMIKENSYKKGCPVPLKDLRYLRIKHLNFN